VAKICSQTALNYIESALRLAAILQTSLKSQKHFCDRMVH